MQKGFRCGLYLKGTKQSQSKQHPPFIFNNNEFMLKIKQLDEKRASTPDTSPSKRLKYTNSLYFFIRLL